MTADHSCIDHAQRLNTGCQCVSLDQLQLAAELERVVPGFDAAVRRGRPHLFADSMVFVGEAHLKRMAEVVQAICTLATNPGYRRTVLQWAPANALHDPGTPGAFLGFDFHLGASGPQLIEINTNAGGGLLNAVLQRAQKACCNDVASIFPGLSGAAAESRFLAMFDAEWATWHTIRPDARPARPRRMVIVDTTPERQFLYPEFVLFERLFPQCRY